MRVCLAVPVFLPFLHLSVFTNLVWRQFCLQSIKVAGKCLVSIQRTCCQGCILQNVIHHLVVHRHAPEERTVHLLAFIAGVFFKSRMILRRIGRTYNHIASVRILYKEILKELCAAFHYRIDLCKILLVAREEILLPQM